MSKKRVENPEDTMQEQESAEMEALSEQAAEIAADCEQTSPEPPQEDCADREQLTPDFMQKDFAESGDTSPDAMYEVSPEGDEPVEKNISSEETLLLANDQFPLDAPDETVTEPVEEPAQQEDAPPAGVVPEAAPRRRKPRKPSDSVLTASGTMEKNVSRDVDDRETEIYASYASHKPIEVEISSLENSSEGGVPVVVCMYGSFKVLVPLSQMNIALKESSNTDTDVVRLRKIVLSMLGANIDVVIRGIDAPNKIAVASRRLAMLYKQRTILNAVDRQGNAVVHEDLNCEARVIAVVPQMARLEMFGLEVRLPATDYKWEYVSNLANELYPGEKIIVKITRIARGEDGKIRALAVSHKAVLTNVQLENAKRLTITDRWSGVVQNFAKGMYFVKLQGMEVVVGCVVSANYTFTSPRLGDVVMVLIRNVDVETGRIRGSITRVIKPKRRT